jgi:hypothetical protein
MATWEMSAATIFLDALRYVYVLLIQEGEKHFVFVRYSGEKEDLWMKPRAIQYCLVLQ